MAIWVLMGITYNSVSANVVKEVISPVGYVYCLLENGNGETYWTITKQ